MDTSTKEIGEFFDEISDTYGDKYSGSDAFHAYFFRERLEESVRGLEVRGCRVLDVGAGTGNLFEHLVNIDADVDYYATDISSGMLERSQIPANRRFLGKISEVALPVQDFDLVFILGVTTYMNDGELESTISHVKALLRKGGRLVVTFTNQESIDWQIRRIFKALGRNFMSRRTVLAQSFTVYPRRLDTLTNQYKNDFEIEDVRGLNHTVFPLNQVMKGTSVYAAKRIHAMTHSKIKHYLSSDFLMIMRKI